MVDRFRRGFGGIVDTYYTRHDHVCLLCLQKSLGERLADKAVFLRLNAGTQEAGFLSAFCSLEVMPKLIIIKYATLNTVNHVGAANMSQARTGPGRH